MIIFFDDYSSCIIAGNTARPITDAVKISREKLSYIIDSTAAPIATVALISTWIGFELGVIGEGFASIGMENVPVYLIFLQSIPLPFLQHLRHCPGPDPGYHHERLRPDV
jgi:Na+/H+ antiporter NhaC